MALPDGWTWKTDPEWVPGCTCATNGRKDVFTVQGDFDIYGGPAPVEVVVEVLKKAGKLVLASADVGGTQP